MRACPASRPASESLSWHSASSSPSRMSSSLRTPPPVPTPEVQSIRGTYVLVRNRATPTPGATPRPASTLSGSFAALASGDAAGTMRQGPSTQADEAPTLRSSYDASQRAEQTTRTIAVGTRTRRTFDAWPPVWRVGTPSPLDYQGLAAAVRSAVEDKDRTVGIKPLKDGDRAVWRAAMELDGSTIELVVDQQTGLVVWCSETSGSRNDTFSATPAWGDAPTRDQVGGTGPTGSAGSPRDVETLRGTDYTYSPSLSTAGRRAGYTPLEPTLVPDGFAVRAVATADATGAPREWLMPRACGASARAESRRAAGGPPLHPRPHLVHGAAARAEGGARLRRPRRATRSRPAGQRSSRSRRRRCSTGPSPAGRRTPGTRRRGRPCSSATRDPWSTSPAP